MVVFYILLLVPMMMQCVSVKGDHITYNKKNERALAFFFVFLTLLVMLRHESVGTDTQNYIRIFDDFSRMDWRQAGSKTVEFGFSFFNKFVLLFTKEPQIFLIIAAIIPMVMIYSTYKRLCVDTSLTIVLFCTLSTFVMLFSGIRQTIAIGIGFIAYEYARKKKPVPFIITVLVAITFHTSAFMLLVMYPLYHARITQKRLYAVIPILALIFIYNKPIFSILSLILSRFTKYKGVISSTGAYTMLILFAVFTVWAYLIPDESKMDVETIGLRNILLFSLMLQMFAPLHTLAMRLNYYYIVFLPLLIPKIIQYRSIRWKQVAVLGRHIMVVFFLAYFFYSAYTGVNLRVFPYHFFWESV